jgi:hypothetical protein
MPFYAKGDRLSVELEDFVADGGVIILLGILFIFFFFFFLFLILAMNVRVRVSSHRSRLIF